MSDIALRVSTSLPAREPFAQAFRWMLLARLLEEKLANLYRAGKINGGVFLGKGQEALSASLGMALKKGDIFAPLIRDQAGRLAFGEDILDAVRTYLGSKLGPMRGREGNVHRGLPREGRYAMISHLGAMISAVCGGLMARRFQGQTGVVGATCVGDGCSSTGAFHEALNLAAVEKLPLVLVVANNQFAYSTPNDREFACKNLVDRAIGYGIEGHTVDATELDACLDVVGRAVERAREGRGPQMVVATLLRLAGHGEHDDAAYIPEALKNSPTGRDCLKVAECTLMERGWASAADLEAWREETLQQVEEAVATVQREPAPDPAEETWCALSTQELDDTFRA
ncbi:MAG: thiamine pyrophosphate-dependent dehydrogenase E1 component subunit alpha [Chthoniobacteraceae bacterium]|nr:thiamine pyrophosphate-dependent dehydrogenase E1 component subunit alpha [Chthoniobacteraceae bacterium]